MAYPKLAGTKPRMLVLESQYWLDVACIRAAEGMGWSVSRTPVLMSGALPREMVSGLLEQLVAFKPDFVMSINLSGMDEQGLFAGLFEDLHIPFVTWFVDDPRTIMMGRDCYGTEHGVALTWEHGYMGYLEERGFGLVTYMPLAVDGKVFNGEPGDTWPLPPTFIGNSMVQSAAEEWGWAQLHPEVESAVVEAIGRDTLERGNFGTGLGTVLGEERIAAWDEEYRRHGELLCFVEGTRRLREELVTRLAPHGLVVCGDEHWGRVTDAWQPYVNYEGGVGAYYRGCPVNLNSTSIQMASAVNQRIFDCPAAGGFLLTDGQGDLGSLFDVETEVAQYQNLDEAEAMLLHYLEAPEERVEITRRAQKRIMGEHTYRHRLEVLLVLLRERFCA